MFQSKRAMIVVLVLAMLAVLITVASAGGPTQIFEVQGAGQWYQFPNGEGKAQSIDMPEIIEWEGVAIQVYIGDPGGHWKLMYYAGTVDVRAIEPSISNLEPYPGPERVQ